MLFTSHRQLIHFQKLSKHLDISVHVYIYICFGMNVTLRKHKASLVDCHPLVVFLQATDSPPKPIHTLRYFSMYLHMLWHECYTA